MKLNKRLLELTDSQFVTLLESGALYTLYPELEGKLFNVQQFESFKEEYFKHQEIEDALYQVLRSFTSMTGADPSDIFDLFEEHKDAMLKALQYEELDIDYITLFESVRNNLDD